MRKCLLGDIITAAAVLRPNSPLSAADMIHQAHAAHKYAKRLGRPHPKWGNGSLMARALAIDPIPGPVDLAALATITLALLQFRRRGWSEPPSHAILG